MLKSMLTVIESIDLKKRKNETISIYFNVN